MGFEFLFAELLGTALFLPSRFERRLDRRDQMLARRDVSLSLRRPSRMPFGRLRRGRRCVLPLNGCGGPAGREPQRPRLPRAVARIYPNIRCIDESSLKYFYPTEKLKLTGAPSTQ
jgi:hypothetical protein